MEHGPDIAQRDTNPAPRALADFRPDAPQQGFDLTPAKIGGRRFREDPRQGPPVALFMISKMDIVYRRFS
jgi:hypothetical protein